MKSIAFTASSHNTVAVIEPRRAARAASIHRSATFSGYEASDSTPPRISLRAIAQRFEAIALDRSVALETLPGEVKLVVAVIVQAIGDCHAPITTTDRHAQACAERFLRGNALEAWSDLIDLDADWIRAVAQRSGYWQTTVPASIDRRAARVRGGDARLQ